MAKFTITPSYHSVKRINIWTVKPSEKLEYSDYKKLESKIKTIGGYYSRFSRAFVFESEPSMDKLNEAFGDTQTVSETAKQLGVSENKIALIDLTVKQFTKIDRRTLKKEYDARKLLVAKTSYYDGMIDGSRSIPENEWKWSDRDFGFEKQFDYSSNPYASSGVIKFGDYRAKYKDDVIQPVKAKTSNQSSINYYVDLDEKKVNDEYSYELDRTDSDSKDHEKGERVIMSFYGNKYCGYISDKRVSQYQIRSWLFGNNQKENVEVKESVSYTVTLDNGVVNGMATFKVDTENECNEISSDAIFFENAYKLPEGFWSSDIVRKISGINGMKRQKSSRKKAEYAMQDQKMIDRSELSLMKNFALWLGWEQKNMEYSRKITGESEEEQNFRMDKWMNEFKVDPIRLVRPKSVLINKLIRANNLLLN
jgi:hypothetical protein